MAGCDPDWIPVQGNEWMDGTPQKTPACDKIQLKPETNMVVEPASSGHARNCSFFCLCVHSSYNLTKKNMCPDVCF